MDHLTVAVEAGPTAPVDRREAAAEEVAAGVKDGVGVNVEVRVVDPETIERSVGKMRRIVDQRPPGWTGEGSGAAAPAAGPPRLRPWRPSSSWPR